MSEDPLSDDAGVAASAAGALAPEGGLMGGLDPINLLSTMAKAAVAAAARPFDTAAAGMRLGVNLSAAAFKSAALIAGVESNPIVQPDPKDRRFSDPTWTQNPLYFWYLQRHHVRQEFVRELVEIADLDGSDAAKLEFLGELLISGSAPTNFLWSNPMALKKAFETGGRSLARGLRNFIDDALNNGGWPKQVDTSPFTVGENLAATPGEVVFRNELMELIQYEPQTDEVHAAPILCSPPWINKYYVMDLAPDRSFIEWAVQHGHTVFAISYRNPDASMSETTLEDYLVNGPRIALDVIKDITGAPKVNLVALCLGGTLAMMLMAFLAAIDDDSIGSVTLLNTLVDFGAPGQLGAFTDATTIERLEQRLQKEGVLSADDMRRTFDLLRPDDLVFNYVASNWLMGQDPPAFDILAWNEDSTNMPSAMHSFYLRSCYLENRLASNELRLSGQHLDLSRIEADTFIVGAVNDHIVPWRTSYRTTQLLPKADVTYVLSSAGHIAGIVNPPGPKASYRTASGNPADPEVWLADTTEEASSWWELWAEWASERGGALTTPPSMGNERYPPLEPAPGSYVHG
ncbi:MAG: alpha/beta fold hydrolase [Acidimicrobiia bacterium]|nr:alpha/beta fold hydrolase [Acidimicrobiia bacterium]NNL47717.1 alpha/beta fold hydrolase [Acidimicrobiia bacterium]